VKKGGIAAILAGVVLVAFILVFVGVGTNQAEKIDYQIELEESVSSESASPSTPSETDYQIELEESVSSESTPPSVPEEEESQGIEEEPSMTPQSTVPIQPSSSSNSTERTFCGKYKCITDKVRRIIDGDTIELKNYLVIRLSLTDAYEKSKSGGPAATAFTTKLCPVGSFITVDQDDRQPFDIYKRILGKVYCGNMVLNSELLDNGNANILTQYCKKSEFAKEDWAQKYGCASK